jgi:hypothetical protein
MMIHFALLSRGWIYPATPPAAAAMAIFSSQVQGVATNLRKTLLLYARDLDGFLSLCLARFIVWRHIHKGR